MSLKLQLFGRTVLALLLVVALPQSARASVIDLVSASYHVAASGFVNGATYQYDVTSSTPVSRNDQPFGGGGGLSLQASANGGVLPEQPIVLSNGTVLFVRPENAFVRASSWATDAGIAFAQYADADASLTFRPLVSAVTVSTFLVFLDPPIEGRRGSASLYDVTANLMLLTLGRDIEPATYTFALDPTHLYTLSASAHSASGIPSDVALYLAAGPAAVPESESTLTFFVVGLGALLLVARSQKFRPSEM